MDSKEKVKSLSLTDEQMEKLLADENKKGISDEEMMRIEQEEAANKYSSLQSTLGGLQDIALMGYGPNILAGARAGSFSSPEYISQRDILNKQIEEIKKEDPGAFLGGQIAGGLGTALIPMGAAAKGAGLLGRMGKAAIAGGVAGLAQDVPDVEGMVQSPFAKEALQERSKAGAMGAAMGPLAEAGVSTVRALTPESVARGFTALGPRKAFVKETRKAAERGGLGTRENIVKFAREEGIFSGIPSIEDVYERSLNKVKQYGSELSDLYKSSKLQESKIIHGDVLTPMSKEQIKFTLDRKDLEGIKNKIIRDINTQDWADVDKKSLSSEIESYFSNLPEKIDIPDIIELHEIKKELGQKAYKIGRTESPTSAEKFWRKAERLVDEEIKSRIDSISKVAGSDVVDQLKDLNKKYSLSSKIYEYASDSLDAERLPYDISGVIRKNILSPEVQVSLSKIGSGIEKIPQVLKPSGAGLAIPFAQIPRNEYRVQNAQEIISQALMQGVPGFVLDEQVKNSPLKPTEKAQLRKSITEGQ